MKSTSYQYKIFAAVVESGHLSTAAQSMHVAPSTISKQLSKLEATLKVKLIDRSTKSIAITPLGELFYQRCKAILNSIEDAENELLENNQLAEGKLHLSFSSILLKTPFMALLQEFASCHPNIKFDLSVSDEAVNLLDLKVDFAIRIGELHDSNLVAIPLGHSKLVFCASQEYLHKWGVPALKSLLTRRDLIIPSYIPLTTLATLLKADKDTSIELQTNKNSFHSCNDEPALHDAACSGLGVCLTFDITVLRAIEDGRLVQLFTDQSFPGRDVHLIYHRRDYMPKNMQLFKAFIKQRFSQRLLNRLIVQ